MSIEATLELMNTDSGISLTYGQVATISLLYSYLYNNAPDDLPQEIVDAVNSLMTVVEETSKEAMALLLEL